MKILSYAVAAIAGVVIVLQQPLLIHIGAQVKQAPMFEVDPFWPRPLPNHWVTGSTIGLSVDAQDNVWTIHRPGSVEETSRRLISRREVCRSASAAQSLRRCSSTTPLATS